MSEVDLNNNENIEFKEFLGTMKKYSQRGKRGSLGEIVNKTG